MSSQPQSQENEMSTQERQRQDQTLAQIRDMTVTAPINRPVVVTPSGRLAHLPGI